MSTQNVPTYEELKRRLDAAESALTAIREGRVDTILGERETPLVVRLAEAEAREAHLKQVLLAIRNVNQLIVAEDDPRRLIERACVNLTETMGYHNAWIALLGGEAARGLGLQTEGPVAAAAAARFDGGFEILRERLECGKFPECMKRAMENEDTLVKDDPMADCPDCPLHAQYGGRSGLVRRLEYDGVTWGILTASVPAAYARDAEEQGLFNEVAGDLAFALYKIATARKLEENRRHLDLVIEGSGVGTWEWNVQTHETLFNAQWAAMLGYTIEELTPYDYTTWERLVHPEDLAQARQALADCVAGRTTDYNCEFRMQHKNGSWVWILDRGRVMIRDDMGNALSMFGTHTDITDLKQAEEALRKAHELSGRIIEDGPVGITTVNRDGEIVFANRQAERLFGLEKSEIQSRCYNAPDWKITAVDGSFFPDEELPFCRVMATGRAVHDVQHAIIRKDGSWGILSINGAPLHDAQGGIERVVFAILDITEHKQAEEKLRAAEETYRNVFLNAQVGMFRTDIKTGMILDANDAVARFTGYRDREEMLAAPFRIAERYVNPGDRDKMAALLRADGEVTDFEAPFRRNDGSTILMRFSARLVPDKGWIEGVSVDVTRERQAEAALNREHAMLARTEAVAHVGSWEWEAEGDKVTWSEELFRIFGLEPMEEAPPFAKHQAFYVPEDRTRLVKAVEECMQNGVPYDLEVRVTRSDGQLRHCVVRAIPEQGAGGAVKRLYGSLHDITEIRHAEERIAILSRMLNAAPAGISIHDTDGRFVFANVENLALHGYDSLEEFLKVNLHELDVPESEALLAERFRKIAEEGEARFEVAHYRKDGSTFPLEVLAKQIEWEGRPAVLSIATDVTESKRAEKALRESEGRVRAKLNALLDPEGDIGTLHLTDVVDCDEIQSLMNDFHALTDIGIGILDLDGNVLVGTGWQDVCVKFHRVHPETEKLCRESDLELTSGVEPGTFKIYKCKNNMWDMVTPIVIGGKHVGNLFLGQFFFEDEAPDIENFREQARRYGFDEDIYLKAYRAIPRWSRETVDQVMTFYCNLIGVISRLSYAHIKLARTSETLRQSAQRFRSFVENANDMVYALSPEGVFTYMSPNWLDFMGEPAEQAIGKSFEPYVHPEDVHLCRAFLEKTLTTGEKQSSVEYRVRHRDGSLRWHVSNGSPVRDETGTVTGYVGIGRDVTEAKQAEQALVQSEKNYRDIFDNSSDCIFIHDAATGAIVDVNRTTCEIFGYSVEEIKRLNVGDFSLNRPPYTSAEAVEWIGKAHMEGPQRFEWLAKNRKGQLIWFENKLLHAQIGGKDRVLVFGSNIDDRKRAEKEHEKLQAQLRQAQKMEAVGRLAGGVAHDFNNMLGIIIGHADMILEDMAPDQQFHADLTEIRKAGARSADLTRQLLAFARKQTVAPKVLDLNKTVQGMLKMLQRLIGEDIDMAWIPGGKVWTLKIDPGQVDQMLANLCVNARDAIADVGKVTIETGNTVFDDDYCRDHAGFVPGEYVMLAVSDNGCGMDSETLAKVFEPFFTTKELGKGTGLGLATVYGVVKQNNGLINVYSEPGQGTTFKIYLPRHKAKAAPLPEKGPGIPSARGHETVLLVEDEQAILKMTTMMLEREGYTVLGASTPGEAIRLAREHMGEIDLLMTDVVMPEMNGRDLAKNLLSLYPNVKRLFMSGYTADVIAHHGVLDEGVHFIQKPFSKKDLAAKLREALRV